MDSPLTDFSGPESRSGSPFTGQTSSSHHKIILNQATLRELQKKDDQQPPTTLQSLSRLYRNDFFSDFEKQVLQLKPNDCPIVQKYSKIETFPIEGRSNFNSITVNTIYSDHPLREFHKRSLKKVQQEDSEQLQRAQEQLEKIDKLPVLIFLHGLGGQLSQFETILQEFRNCADIFGIDLPGFGNSKPNLRDTKTFNRLSEFTEEELDTLEKSLGRMTWADFTSESIVDILHQILIGKFPNRNFIFVAHSMGCHLSVKLINKLPQNRVESMIMLAPPSFGTFPLPLTSKLFLGVCGYVPQIFDFYRFYDRVGGLYSKSVNSYIHPEENDLLKRLTQLRWNLDTNSSIFLRYYHGFHPISPSELISAASKINKSKNEPRFLIACGDDDKVTPFKKSEAIAETLVEHGYKVILDKIKLANHSLFLDRPRYLTGVVYQFVEELNVNIDCAWVLKVKAIISGDKWGLKNEEKWQKVVTISKPMTIPGKISSPILGMKTLRQSDPVHNPKNFESQHPEVHSIVDIGSDTPAYDPSDFERIKYVKFKTESKVTPDNLTIARFITVLDKLIEEKRPDQVVGVHCHYGQNRTGFFICCYLVERLGWTVKEALYSFEKSKPPGIRHEHFKNALYLRYGE